MAEELTIGLDIGGTKMAFVAADRQGNIHHSSSLPTEARADFDHTLNRIAGQLNPLIARYENVCGIGIGVPGPVESVRGIALHAANLGWKNVGLRDAIAERLRRPLPIYLDNDVNAGAIGEQLFGAAKGVANCLYLIVGTGLGGAVISNNRILRGATNSEMEIGHVSLDPINGLPCSCGQRGCLEMSASGSGIVAQALNRIADYPDSRLSAKTITTHEIIRLAGNGDALAATVMNEAAEALGIACAWCVNLFNPALIIFAGGLARASWHLLEKPLRQSMRARCLPMNYEAVTVSLSKLTDGALGASALVWHQ
ncbi:MAG: ROK family protein [Chloroflexi bacterium]|nr:ROK family protein [Chloroflexota bacterium]